jgi:hypothetical protein
VEHSPYRESARPILRAFVGRRWLSRACMSGIVVGGSWLAWLCLPWTSHVDLRATKEVLPAHSPLSQAYWNDIGTRALVVGSNGEVFERTSELGEVDHPQWEQLASGTREPLLAVTGGRGPRLGGSEYRVFAIGAHGAAIDCTRERQPCVPLESGVDETLRAISVDGGQAIIVGDHGTILHVVPDAH